jgi:D-serine deaminase-like pyridoxal phosphate-dependent protein
VAAIAEEERQAMAGAAERLRGEGLEAPTVSVGSTPTVMAAESFQGIDEIRPGNYVFLDMAALRLGLAEEDRVALSVQAAVVSKNADHFIIDAGSKTLSSDRGAHSTAVPGFGLARPLPGAREEGDGPLARAVLQVAKLSEEHGFVARRDVRTGELLDLPLGSRLAVVPNHACPVANLAEALAVVGAPGEPEDVLYWPVSARAKVR